MHEQKFAPLQHHTDTYKARSCHWVIYSPPSIITQNDLSESSQIIKPQPIGTIRLVPYPHSRHPQPGSRNDVPPEEEVEVEDAVNFFTAPPPVYVAETERATTLHDGIEPYVKLGRICVIKEFRGNRFSDLLIQTALKRASETPEFSKEILGAKATRVPEWKGLGMVQAPARPTTLETRQRNGFVVDEGLGSWYEAGNETVAMFRRVELR